MKKADAIKYLEDKGDDVEIIVRTPDEEKTLLENYAKKVEEEIIPGKISELHKQYDEDFFEVTGERKEHDEKTYNFGKRLLKKYKEKAESLSEKEQRIADLEKQIKDGTGDKQLRADLENVQKEYNALKEEAETKIKNLTSQHDQYRIESDIRSSLGELSFSDKIPAEALKSLQNEKIAKIAKMAKYEDGKLIFLAEDGTPKRNPHNALNPYTAKELLTEELKSVIGETKKPPSVRGEILKEKDKDGKITKLAIVIPDGVNTRSKLGDFLVSKGILRGTDEYRFAYRTYGEKMPVQ